MERYDPAIGRCPVAMLSGASLAALSLFLVVLHFLG